MSYRVQFSISDKEYAELKLRASNAGFSNVSMFCKSIVFPNSKTIEMRKMSEILEITISNVSNMPFKNSEGSTYYFYLRDLYPNPPSSLGTHINKKIDSGELTILKRAEKKDRTGTCLYYRADK